MRLTVRKVELLRVRTNVPPNSTVGAVQAAEQRTNALWTATIDELSFKKGDLILWCWFSAGCAGGDRFSSRSLRSAAGRTTHAQDRRLCAWPHPRADRSQPSSSRSHVQPSFAPSPGRRRRHALSEREVCRISCGLKGSTPAAAARSRKITATRSSASRRSPTRPPPNRSAKQRAGVAPVHSSHAPKAAIVPEGA